MRADRLNLLDYDPAGLRAWLSGRGHKPFRAAQVLKWIYHHGLTDFAGMTNLARTLRAELRARAEIRPPAVIGEQRSVDGTRKWLLRVDAENSIETVFIPENGRGTLCISSQAGCPLDCRFCATARQGFNRNLTTAEIIGQVWLANRALGYFEHGRRLITNIVFMGMGEPLLNYDNVLKAINLLTADLGFGLARRKVTVSTAGIIPNMDRLREDSNVSLAVSLHASNNALRSAIVPINRSYPLSDLLPACKRYSEGRDNEPVTIEYVMLKGVNDSARDARELARCLGGIPAKVNLIPFNRFPGARYQCSSPEAIDRFRSVLARAGIITLTRKTRGADIDAACGQLAGRVRPRAARYRQGPARPA